MIRGVVDSDGTILEGSGFTVTHLSIGQFRIDLSTSFPRIPAATASASVDGDNPIFANIKNLQTNNFIVSIFHFAGSHVNARSNFIVVGPR